MQQQELSADQETHSLITGGAAEELEMHQELFNDIARIRDQIKDKTREIEETKTQIQIAQHQVQAVERENQAVTEESKESEQPSSVSATAVHV